MKIHPYGYLDLTRNPRFRLGVGVGRAEHHILAFDRALAEAGFSDYNLLKVSSVLPAGARLSPEVDLPKGSLLPIAFGEMSSRESGKIIGAAVAVALPKDGNSIGIIMEVTGEEPASVLTKRAERLARKALRDRGIEVGEVLTAGVDAQVTEGYTCVFAGVAIWSGRD